MNGVHVSNLFGEQDQVFAELARYHKETIKYNALMFMGSSNLLGNPAKLVSGVGTGVTDFFVKPI